MSVEPKFVDTNVLVYLFDADSALRALAEEIRARMHTPRSEFVSQDQAFAAARTTIAAARRG